MWERDEKIKAHNKNALVGTKKDKKIEELVMALRVNEVLSFLKRVEDEVDFHRYCAELVPTIHLKRNLLIQCIFCGKILRKQMINATN